MTDDETNRDDEQPTPEGEAAPPEPQEPAEQPAAEEPAEAPQEEAPAEQAEEPAAEVPAEQAEEPAGDAEETAGDAEETEQPAAEQAEAQEAAEEPAAEAEAPAEAEQAAEQPAAEERKAKGDEPPGASLEPLRIEPERELSAEERARLEAEAEERARREAEATADDDENEEAVARRAKVDLAPDTNVQATGKRKSAVARVILRRGGGAFQVNGRDLAEYFPRSLHQTLAKQPLVVSGFEGHVDVRVRVHGGGLGGQADAVRHGIARALCDIDPELRPELKRRGMLTRDARVKERRKAGLKKARKRPQFSKR